MLNSDQVSAVPLLAHSGDDRAPLRHRAGVPVVWKLDRLGRSMLDTVKIVLDLDRRGVGFLSLTESFDTKTTMGRGVLALLAAVAEDERAWRRRGRHVGRPPKLGPEQLVYARRMIVGHLLREAPDLGLSAAGYSVSIIAIVAITIADVDPLPVVTGTYLAPAPTVGG